MDLSMGDRPIYETGLYYLKLEGNNYVIRHEGYFSYQTACTHTHTYTHMLHTQQSIFSHFVLQVDITGSSGAQIVDDVRVTPLCGQVNCSATSLKYKTTQNPTPLKKKEIHSCDPRSSPPPPSLPLPSLIPTINQQEIPPLCLS